METFEAALAAVERAKEALVAAVPSPRGKQHRTAAEALLDFEAHLKEATVLMDSWRTNDVDEDRRACAEGLQEAARRAERLRMEAPPMDYEGLVAALGDLIAPLEVFADTERRLAEDR
ncbi:MAG TPA: hypothetical protein VG602_00165 [Actinomycetota bacterium]|nr:hypothetical protein [Actinomycetota bacterium]